VVSSGAAAVTVPNVVGLTQAAAQTAITGAGLTVGTVTTASSATVPAGSVISQNPAAGASAAPGSAVALVVSSGAAAVGGVLGGASQVNFGNVNVNSTKTKDLNITNTSTSQSLVVSVPTPSPPFSLVSGGGTFTIGPCTIASCPNHKVTFSFAPTNSGHATQTLIISSTDPARPTRNITLDGMSK